MAEEDFLAKLADVAKLQRDTMTDTTEITPAEWDSIEVLDLISAIDEAFGVTVPVASLTEARSVGELRKLIASAAKPQ